MTLIKIEITKDTKDLRPGIDKKLPKGTKFRCTPELANQYIDKKLAKQVDEQTPSHSFDQEEKEK